MEFKINNNGDTYETYIINYRALCDAIAELSRTLNEMHPHGRNYQTCDSPTQSHANDVDKFMIAHASLENIRDLRDDIMASILDNQGSL